MTKEMVDIIYNHIEEEEVGKICVELLEPLFKAAIEKAFEEGVEQENSRIHGEFSSDPNWSKFYKKHFTYD